MGLGAVPLWTVDLGRRLRMGLVSGLGLRARMGELVLRTELYRMVSARILEHTFLLLGRLGWVRLPLLALRPLGRLFPPRKPSSSLGRQPSSPRGRPPWSPRGPDASATRHRKRTRCRYATSGALQRAGRSRRQDRPD